MEWFRPRLRLGAYLALVALALNLALSFGHHHVGEAAAHQPAAENSAGVEHTGGDDPDHQGPPAAHPCFACVVATATAITADPPALPVPAERQITKTAAIASVEPPASDRRPFEARAPPRS